MAFISISPDKQYFTKPNGQPIFVLGASYQGYFDRVWQMWDNGKFNLDLINHDFKKMADTGLNVVRLFVQAPLANDIADDDFNKLDQVLQLAANHRLLVLLVFNDQHNLNLSQVTDIDLKIVDRYQDDPVILGWDLENDPRFYHFAAAIYPNKQPAPIQTNRLVNHYGVRISQQQALTQQQQRRIPRHLRPDQAYYYSNALQYFIEFRNDAEHWASENGQNSIDYLFSSAAESWQPLITVLNETVAAWLAARQGPIQAIDANHLISVSYRWPLLAALPANNVLDFQQFQQVGVASQVHLKQTEAQLASLRGHFPQHPILQSEFGYANQTAPSPATAKPISESETALFEGALLAHLRANGFAGGLKWCLNDAVQAANPQEASYGIYREGDHPKTIYHLLRLIQQQWAAPPQAGSLKLVQDPVGLAVRFDLGDSIMLGGGTFQDEALSWQAETVATCFVRRSQQAIQIQAQGKGNLRLDPWHLGADWPRNKPITLSQIINNKSVAQASFSPETVISFTVSPQVIYQLTIAETKNRLLALANDDEIIPNPGEHVVLLPDSNATLGLALDYIRHFAPDFSFASNEVAGRWPYVTVVASPSQISDAVLTSIQASGAQIVDRISTLAEAEPAQILAELVRQNRRFLSADLLNPPDDSPIDPPTDPPASNDEFYIVQPGDSLSRIALQFYGKGSLWPHIFEANKDILDSPSLIRPGMQLRIPPQP